MSNLRNDWSAEEDAVLTAEWKKGISCSQIAKTIRRRFGNSRTRNSIIGRKHRLGLPDRTTPVRIVRDKQRVKRRALPKMVEPVKPVAKAAKPVRKEEPIRRVEITELARSECRWPVTEDSPHLFCGRPQAEDSSYCATHRDRSISPKSEATLKVSPVSAKVAAS